MKGFSEKMNDIENMNDLELLDFYVDECGSFIDPRIFRHIQNRGLTYIVNTGLVGSKREKKSIIRARLHSTGRYTGDPEIERVAATIHRIKTTQAEIYHLDPTDAHTMKSLSERMSVLVRDLLEFYG